MFNGKKLVQHMQFYFSQTVCKINTVDDEVNNSNNQNPIQEEWEELQDKKYELLPDLPGVIFTIDELPSLIQRIRTSEKSLNTNDSRTILANYLQANQTLDEELEAQ